VVPEETCWQCLAGHPSHNSHFACSESQRHTTAVVIWSKKKLEKLTREVDVRKEMVTISSGHSKIKFRWKVTKCEIYISSALRTSAKSHLQLHCNRITQHVDLNDAGSKGVLCMARPSQVMHEMLDFQVVFHSFCSNSYHLLGGSGVPYFEGPLHDRYVI
jgi:hypothetical protein